MPARNQEWRKGSGEHGVQTGLRRSDSVRVAGYRFDGHYPDRCWKRPNGNVRVGWAEKYQRMSSATRTANSPACGTPWH